MNLLMSPSLETVNNTEGGISTIVRAYHRYLPSFGVEFVNNLEDADVYAVHAGMAGQLPSTVPVVSFNHGLHWTADYQAQAWEYETNRDVVRVLRHAKEIIVPSSWVAETFERDLRMSPYVIGHGVDWESWQHQEENKGYVLWNKNRTTDVCNPEPAIMLAKMFPKRLFMSTFIGRDAKPTPNMKVTGVLPYEKSKKIIQQSGVYLATTKETFGLGILEALASGKPVLGFAHGGILDLVVHGETGYLARPGDYNDLATGLTYCFRHQKRLGQSAIEFAKDHTWERVCERVLEVLYEAMAPDPATVAVVIPIFNKESTLQRTVESVLFQEDPPDEIILVDNNSTDGSRDVAVNLAKEWGLTFLNEERQGVAHARNTGIAFSKSKYIVCLDSDDAIMPYFTGVCKEALEEDPSLGVAYTSLRWVGPDGTTDVADWPPQYNYDNFITSQNQVPTCCMFRRDAWEKLGGYRQRYAPFGAGTEDAEFFFRMGAYGWGGLKVTNEPLFIYSVGVGVTAQPGYKEPNWRRWHPWVLDNQHPFASMAKPANLSHPVREYDTPLVSVVIPLGKHHTKYVIDALDSLEAQSYRKWEAIVVCDGFSVPQSLQKAYPYVRWVGCTKRGAGASRNVGAGKARAPYLLFLDADDWLEPEAIKLLFDAQKGGKVISYSDYISHSHINSVFAEEAAKEGRLLEYDEKTGSARIQYYSATYNREKALRQPELDASGNYYAWNLITSLVPKLWHNDIGGFDESMDSWEDWDYWIRMARCNYPFVRVQASLMNYRVHTGTRREDGYNKQDYLVSYMKEKYEREGNMCCGGKGGQVQQYTPPPPMSINMGVMQNMNSDSYLMIELADGKLGDHRIKGPVTGTDYGYRSHGSRFLMHVDDINHFFTAKTRTKVIVLEIEQEPVVEIEESDPPVEETEEHNGVPAITAMQGLQSKTLSLLEQAGLQTVKDVLNLGEEGLLAIKGIGPTLAQRVLESAQETLDAVTA